MIICHIWSYLIPVHLCHVYISIHHRSLLMFIGIPQQKTWISGVSAPAGTRVTWLWQCDESPRGKPCFSSLHPLQLLLSNLSFFCCLDEFWKYLTISEEFLASWLSNKNIRNSSIDWPINHQPIISKASSMAEAGPKPLKFVGLKRCYLAKAWLDGAVPGNCCSGFWWF